MTRTIVLVFTILIQNEKNDMYLENELCVFVGRTPNFKLKLGKQKASQIQECTVVSQIR